MIKEFVFFRYYAIKESEIPTDEHKKMRDGCEGYAITSLYDAIKNCRHYSENALKSDLECYPRL